MDPCSFKQKKKKKKGSYFFIFKLILKTVLMSLRVSTYRFTVETQPGLKESKDAAKRLIDLGLVFSPLEDVVRDTVESLKAKGWSITKVHYCILPFLAL